MGLFLIMQNSPN